MLHQDDAKKIVNDLARLIAAASRAISYHVDKPLDDIISQYKDKNAQAFQLFCTYSAYALYLISILHGEYEYNRNQIIKKLAVHDTYKLDSANPILLNYLISAWGNSSLRNDFENNVKPIYIANLIKVSRQPFDYLPTLNESSATKQFVIENLDNAVLHLALMDYANQPDTNNQEHAGNQSEIKNQQHSLEEIEKIDEIKKMIVEPLENYMESGRKHWLGRLFRREAQHKQHAKDLIDNINEIIDGKDLYEDKIKQVLEAITISRVYLDVKNSKRLLPVIKGIENTLRGKYVPSDNSSQTLNGEKKQ